MIKPFTFLSCLLLSFVVKAQSPVYNFYYGNLHAHSSYSDGNKDASSSGHSTPYQNYMYASGSLNFDFLGISEHNHRSAGMNLANYARGLRQADSATVNGQFVALYGMEWGVISGGGHVLVYGVDQLLGWEAGNYDVYISKNNYQALFQEINRRPGAFALLAHPNNSDYGNLANNPAFSNRADSAIVGTVMRSGPAMSTNTTYLNPTSGSYESYFRKILARGYHTGISLDHDNHNTTFGRTTPARLVVLAPALTKADLMQALRARRFYASDDWNTQVNFYLNNQPMGSNFTGSTAPSINLNVTDGDAEPVQSITLLRGVPGSGVNAVSVTSAPAGTASISFVDTVTTGTYYYYAVINQSDGDKIITSPIWYTRSSAIAGIPAREDNAALEIYPNPVSMAPVTISYYLQKQEEVSITVLDMLGREVYNVVNGEQQQAGSHEYVLNLAAKGLQHNMYLIRLVHDDKVTYRKLVVVR